MSAEILSTEVIRPIAVFLHLLLFAMAFYTLLACDYAIWVQRWNTQNLTSISIQMKILLTGLWLTGLFLIAIEPGLDITAILNNNKLIFKIFVVTMLTVNGILIHKIAIPKMSSPNKISSADAKQLTTMSTLSSSHWVLAAFIGCFKPFVWLEPVTIIWFYISILILCGLFVIFISPISQRKINKKKANDALIDLGLRKQNNNTITLLCLEQAHE